MTPAEVARALVAHRRFEWREGMAARTSDGARWRLWRGDHGMLRGQGEPSGYVGGWESWAEVDGGIPDLSDPATAGVLVGMLFDVWPTVEIRKFRAHVEVYTSNIETVTAPTLGEAAGCALLAIWSNA